MIETTSNIEYFKSYHNDDYSKMISYMISRGNSTEFLTNELKYYIENQNINVVKLNKQIKYVNNYKVEYAEILYETYGEKYTLIMGSVQIGEYVYFINYDDNTSSIPDLETLFTFEII